MGHIRLGRLPKTSTWTGVFNALKEESISQVKLANATAVAARDQFETLEQNQGVNYCFWVLVRIATASRGSDFKGELNRLGLQNVGINSGLGFVNQVAQAVDKELKKRGLTSVFVQMAELSLRETLTSTLIENTQNLFGTKFEDIHSACRNLSSPSRFSQTSRKYFSHFISRIIKFVTDKEISNYVGPKGGLKSPERVLDFQHTLDLHCYQTSRIIEDFASGWYSKHNWQSNDNIKEEEASGFTAYALKKIQMELRTEQK